MVETSIRSQLKQAIQDVSSKSAEVSAGSFASDIAAAKASQAQSIIRSKENIVQVKQADYDNVTAKLQDPPKKEVEGEKKGCGHGETKSVVDQEAVKDLQARQKASQIQLAQAKSEVADARQEAETAATDAMTKAGVSSEQQSQMQSLMDRIAAVQDSLGEGKPVKDEDVAKLITDFKEISKDLTKEDNKSGVLSKAFYNPVKEGLQKISDLIEKNATAATASTTPANSTDSNTSATTASSNSSSSSSSSTTTSDSSSSTPAVTPVGAGVGG